MRLSKTGASMQRNWAASSITIRMVAWQIGKQLMLIVLISEFEVFDY